MLRCILDHSPRTKTMRILFAGLMVIGTAFPAMATEYEPEQRQIDLVRSVGSLSYVQEKVSDDEIKEDLINTCNFMQVHRSERKLRDMHVRLASRLDTREQIRQYADYISAINGVAKASVCPGVWQ